MEKIPEIIHESWHKHLQPLFDDPKLLMIKNQILPKAPFYPKPQDIFRVFSMPLPSIKVVILGQDPYPNGEATGLAFAVSRDTKTPPSLQVIKDEIVKSNAPTHEQISIMTSKWKLLEHWHEQGVFLLNTALTVQQRIAGSHLNYWNWFTREVIKIISIEQSAVWLLWGAKAKGFKEYIDHSTIMDECLIEVMTPTNGVLEAPHPAAEKYNGGTGNTFTGCNHFNMCNDILTHKQQSIIYW